MRSSSILLGRAGHDRDHVDLRRVEPDLLGVVGLGQHAEHLLRRLGGGEVVDEIVVQLLHEVGPRRAAGGDERQRAALVHEALDELAGLLHDGDVGGEVGVEHGLEAEAAQGGVELAGEVGAGRQAEGLAEGHAHRRGDLHDAVLAPGRAAPPRRRRSRRFRRWRRWGSGRSTGRTCTQGDSASVMSPAGGHAGVDAAVEEGQRPDVLHLLADLHAAAAFDALSKSRMIEPVESSGWRSGTLRLKFSTRMPKSAASVCSSQLPLRPQVRQSLGWLERISSSTVRRTSDDLAGRGW